MIINNSIIELSNFIHRKGAKDAKKNGYWFFNTKTLRPLRLCGEMIFQANG